MKRPQFAFWGSKCKQSKKKPKTLGVPCILLSLSDELLLHILSYLDLRQLCCLATLCKKLNTVTEDDLLWKTYFYSYFNEQDHINAEKKLFESWKMQFKHHYTTPKMFPIYGVVLGKTTRAEIEKIQGCQKGDREFYTIHNTHFWFHDKSVVFHMYIVKNIYQIPAKWKSLGFSWNTSYQQYRAILLKVFGNCKIKELPHIENWRGARCFRAKLLMHSKENGVVVEVVLTFAYGKGDADSKGTLYSITVYVK